MEVAVAGTRASETDSAPPAGLEGLLGLREVAFRFAQRLVGEPNLAEDVVQQAYLDALGYLERGALHEEGVRPWFLRVVSNAARSHLRSEIARKRREAAVPAAVQEPASERGLVGPLRVAVSALEVKYRAPIVLCYENGLSQREAAAVLDIPETTLSDRLRVGLERLKRMLTHAGYAALPAAILGGLSRTAPIVPASLAGRIEALVSSGARAEPRKLASRAARRHTAAKGGLTMKILAGVVLAGAVAAVAALLAPGRGGTVAPLPSAGKGKPVIEHFAFTETEGYLDGPRLESQGPARKSVAVDRKGNVYFCSVNGVPALRVARVDGMVETIASDDGWGGALPIDEGPAAFIGNLGYGTAIGRPSTAIAIKGLPLEGGDKGYLLVSSGKSIARDNCMYKVWKNKEKDGRWWFKFFTGRGKSVPPSTVGQSVRVKDVKFRGFPGVGPGVDGNIYFHDRGYLYRYDDDQDALTCVLAREDYTAKVNEATGKKNPTPDTIAAAEDGGFYVGFYNGTYPTGWVFKVSADRKTVEPIAKDAGRGKHHDGPGLRSGYFGGPWISGYFPGGNVFFGAIDDGWIRRWKDGRVSTLCRNGEWREFKLSRDTRTREPRSLLTDKMSDTMAPYWGRGWTRTGDDAFYVLYLLGPGSGRILRVGPVDWNKPTTGTLVGGN